MCAFSRTCFEFLALSCGQPGRTVHPERGWKRASTLLPTLDATMGTHQLAWVGLGGKEG